MDYFSRKSLSKYSMNTIEFNKHDAIFHKWHVAKICGQHRATVQNYKATWTLLLTNEKAKSTFTRQLLRLLTWALLLVLFKNLHVHDGKNINQSNCKKQTHLNLFRISEILKRTCLPTHFLHWLGSNWKRRTIN
jgi:hypothetical protein